MEITTGFGIFFLILAIAALVLAIVTFTVTNLPQGWIDNKTAIGTSLSITCGLLLVLAGYLFYYGSQAPKRFADEQRQLLRDSNQVTF